MTSTQKTSEQINRDFEERDTIRRSRELGIPYIDIEKILINNVDILKLIPEDQAKSTMTMPFSLSGKNIKLATFNPNIKTTKKLVELLSHQGFKSTIYLCSKSGFNETVKTYSSKLLFKKTIKTKKKFKEDSVKTLENRNKEFVKLEKKISTILPKKALNEIEILAVKSRASDIHLQPFESGVELRFRIDGILHPVLTIDKKTGTHIIRQVKYESKMISNVSDVPQDGRLEFIANDRKVDVRISTLPTEYDESVVMRLLDSEKGIRNFKELGFSDFANKKIGESLKAQNGMILISGPTGSGKTTLLYSILNELNTAEKKLITLEDPVEYHLKGISQSPVNEQKDYTFETGLKSILRHDPDIILIGEIREYSTAKLSSEAALTGHIVLSTLHTNSAVGSVSRLRNLGLENFSISSSLNSVFAVRLIRKVCNCAKKKHITEDPQLLAIIARIKKIIPKIKIPNTIPEKIGCDACFHTGYAGRMAICESFKITKEIQKLILNNKPDLDILKHLHDKTDFLSLFEDGMLKVLTGETTLEELYRVAGQ